MSDPAQLDRIAASRTLHARSGLLVVAALAASASAAIPDTLPRVLAGQASIVALVVVGLSLLRRPAPRPADPSAAPASREPASAGASGHAARQLDELRSALEFGDVVMEYQPIVDLTSGTTVGLEALARWRHPELGLVRAADFLRVAEASDLVFALGRLSLTQACRDVAALHAAGHRLAVHINVSVRHLERADVVDDVRRSLEEAALPPGLLTVEVAGSRLPAISDQAVRRLRTLRELGLSIAIDDLAAGHRTWTRLVDLPVDVVKLDRSFVSSLDARPGARAVCAGVKAMSDELGIRAIAEGVETAAEEETLLGLGYRWAQGYRYSAALPRTHLESWLTRPESAPAVT